MKKIIVVTTPEEEYIGCPRSHKGPQISDNMRRAVAAVATWPQWKRDVRLTKYSPL